jgi:hypothetical protein
MNKKSVIGFKDSEMKRFYVDDKEIINLLSQGYCIYYVGNQQYAVIINGDSIAWIDIPEGK